MWIDGWGPLINIAKVGLQGGRAALEAGQEASKLATLGSRIASAFSKLRNTALIVKARTVVTTGRNIVGEIATFGRGFMKATKLKNGIIQTGGKAFGIAEKIPALQNYTKMLRTVGSIASKSPGGGRALIKAIGTTVGGSYILNNKDVILEEIQTNLGLDNEQANRLLELLSKQTTEGVTEAAELLEGIQGGAQQSLTEVSPDFINSLAANLEGKPEVSPEMVADIAVTLVSIAVPMATCGVAAYEWVKIVNKANGKHNFVAMTNAIAASTTRTTDYLYRNNFFDSELKNIHQNLGMYNNNVTPENLNSLLKYYSYINPQMIYSFNRMVQDDKLQNTFIEEVFSNDSILKNLQEMIIEGIMKTDELSIPLTLHAYAKMFEELPADQQNLVMMELPSIDIGQ